MSFKFYLHLSFLFHKKNNIYHLKRNWTHFRQMRKRETRDSGLLVRPETRDPGPILWVRPEARYPRPETRDPTHRWDAGPKTQHPGSWRWIFREFSHFSLKPGAYEWIHVLYAFYVCFVCFSLPYQKAYTLLIFDHLNKLLFPSFCKTFHHAAVMKCLNFLQNQWQ